MKTLAADIVANRESIEHHCLLFLPLDVGHSSVLCFSQLKLYQLVIEDVVTNVRDAFLDEGVDEQVLQELKQIWTNRLMASKAVEATPEPLTPQTQPAILANNPKVSECVITIFLMLRIE
jgi:hypothetical protein